MEKYFHGVYCYISDSIQSERNLEAFYCRYSYLHFAEDIVNVTVQFDSRSVFSD